jgi:hypothetical protein
MVRDRMERGTRRDVKTAGYPHEYSTLQSPFLKRTRYKSSCWVLIISMPVCIMSVDENPHLCFIPPSFRAFCLKSPRLYCQPVPLFSSPQQGCQLYRNNGRYWKGQWHEKSVPNKHLGRCLGPSIWTAITHIKKNLIITLKATTFEKMTLQYKSKFYSLLPIVFYRGRPETTA